MSNPTLKIPNIFRKIVSFFVMFAFVITGFGPSLASAGHTIEGSALNASVTATPNSGTQTDGQTVEVNITLPGAVDSTDTNPFSSPSCLVNGVNVASTFTNLTDTSGGGFVDGQFRFTYTVGTSDADRTAGNVPIDCTIQQSHSVHISTFTDNNTVAIDASGEAEADTTPPTVTSTSPTEGAQNVALNSTVQVTFSEPMNQSTINSDTFFVSGGALEVGSITFSGNTAIFTPSSLLSADRQYTAVVQTGVEDSAGNAMAAQYSWDFTTVVESTGTAPSLSMVSISPSSGTIQAGDTVTVTFTEEDSQTDLSVTGSCKINGVDVADSFENMNNGTYTVTYTVGASDGERPAGHIPVTCQLGNSAGNTTASAWLDSNTLAIDTNDDGVIDNGTNNLGFTVSASPSSGTVSAGGQIVVSMQDPLPSGDVVIVPEGQTGAGSVTVSNGCKVNNVDVSGSYAYHGNGLYKVTYTVSAEDTDRAAGELPFDCTLSNHTGTVHLVAFTDNNTVAVDASVEVGEASADKDITSFKFMSLNPHVSGTISGTNVTLTVPFGTNVTALVPTIEISAEATVNPASGASQNFSSPVQYTVTAEDNSTKTYTVTVNVSAQNTPTLESIAITTPATKLSYTVGESLDISGLVVTGTYSDGSTQVESISTSNITGFNSSQAAANQVLTITVGSRTTTYTVNINAAASASAESATLSNASPSVIITDSNQAMDITIASGTTNPTIDVSSLITAGVGVLPAITITAANANNAEISIPAGTTVTSSDVSWNGIITAPTVTTVTLPTISGQTLSLDTAIEIGFNGSLTFDKAVRILLPSLAGKRSGYVRTGISFTEITTTCSADSQAAADAMAAGAECRMDVGADLVIWTKHFTTFAAYTQSTAGGGALSGGGGGGGGGGAVGIVFANQAISRVILGCDIRTIGFSTVTGESCALNIPNALTPAINLNVLAGVNIIGGGQVLGVTTSFLFTQTLRTGSRGNEVIQLQSYLNKLGYNLVVDGVFGPNTRAAVIQFQVANSLVGDGVVGPITRAALNLNTSNS
ncbi:Ig-like domain-containing protein [Candidatus Nomurabacteria bacterium]|nr:Ig-like domain-containing protein [Candidatus Nomurabacteria bacterium]